MEKNQNQQAKSPKGAPKAAILQMHTTGPDLMRDFIIQIGFRPLEDRATSVIEYFKPGGHINRLAQFQSGLSLRYLESKPFFGEYAEQWSTRISQYDYIFYYPGVMGDLESWFHAKLGLDLDQTNCINLKRLAGLFFPNVTDSGLDSLHHFLLHKPFPQGKDIMPATLLMAEKQLQVILDRMMSDTEPTAAIYRYLIRSAADKGNREMIALNHLAKTYGQSGQMKTLWTTITDDHPEKVTHLLHSIIGPDDSQSEDVLQQPDHDKSYQSVKTSVLQAFFNTPYLKKGIRKFEKRPQQITFSEQVLNTINQGGFLLIEAPTGIGKSIGYLAPTAFFLEKNPNVKIVVATATKNLQDQILSRDWPLLGGRFPELSIASLKGKGNFLCWSALLRAYEVYVQGGSGDEILAWLALLLIVTESNGDLENISGEMQHWLLPLKEIIHDVRADIHCDVRSCSQRECLYHRHIRQAEKAHIIVTNHHKVTGLPQNIQSSVAAIIMDEADRFPDNARNALSVELNSGEVFFYIRRQFGSERRRGFLDILEHSLKKNESDYRQTLEQVHAVRNALTAMKEAILYFRQELLAGTETYRPPRLIEYPVFKTGKTFDSLVQPLLYRAKEIQSIMNDLSEKCAVPEQMQFRCGGYAREMQEILGTISCLSDGFNSENTVLHYQEYGDTWAIIATPVYLSEILSESLYKQNRAVIFSSATLYVDGKVELISRELGLTSKQKVKSYRIESLFQYKDQVYCGIDTSIPPYSWKCPGQKERYIRAIAQAIIVYAIAANGRSLVLFTSWKDMNQVFQMVAPVLQKYDIIPILQRGSSLYETRLFRDIEYSVLFGVDRFWYGVDFPGRTLSQVIIAKAPNPNLSNPVIRHRQVHEDDFMSRTYPALAALRLRQGFGRLIRSRSDRGAVILLDSRYGFNANLRSHLDELPVSGLLEIQKSALMEKALKISRLWAEFQERRIDPFLESPAETN